MTDTPKKSRQSLEEYCAILEQRLDDAQIILDNLQDLKSELINGHEAIPSIESVKQDMTAISKFNNGNEITEINDYHQELITSDTSIKKTIEKKIEDLDEQVDDLEGRQRSIKQFEKELLGYEETIAHTDEETGETTKNVKKISGLKDNFESALSSLCEDKENAIEELKNLYSDYDKKIAKLLPKATSAGLATAYEQTSTRYNNKANRMHYAFVLTVLIIAVTGFLNSFPNTIDILKSLGLGESHNKSIKTFFSSFPLIQITLPLIWISIVCQSKAKTYTRLYAEYQHKSNLCKTFDGLKREAGERENEDLIDELLKSMVTVTANNPADHLDKIKHKGLVQEIIDTVRGGK